MSKEKSKGKSGKNLVSLDGVELKDFLRHIINNNRYLQEKGKPSITTSVVGESGLGKTSICRQIADEFNLRLVKINLAQIDESSDLVGYPVAEFEIIKRNEDSEQKETKWVPQSMLETYVKLGWDISDRKQMSYAPPSWLVGPQGDNRGILLLLDDHNRAHIHLLQAAMEISATQEYLSWKLPPDSHVLLTENPSGGEYMTNEMDSAMTSRYTSVNLVFKETVWAAWAERESIDSRC